MESALKKPKKVNIVVIAHAQKRLRDHPD